MNKTPDITIDITTNVSLSSILKDMHHQWGYQAITDGIIDFCCDQNDTKFEDMLAAALKKFQEDNA